MEEWAFLLQKDGDRSWLPLDSPDIEILEGRYRIVARTQQPHTDISIRICHLAIAEEPPKRRIQKRSSRTNESGLMVVAPFTHVQPGVWEISCFSTDLMSGLVGDTLHHSVRLRVAAYAMEDAEWDTPEPCLDFDRSASGELDSDAEPLMESAIAERAADSSNALPAAPAANNPTESQADSQTGVSAHELAALNVEIAQALGLSMDRLVEMTDQLSQQLVEEVFREFNLPLRSPAVELADATEPSDAVQQPAKSVSVDAAMLQIVLDQEVLMAHQGQTVILSGRLESDPFATALAESSRSSGMSDTAPSVASVAGDALVQEFVESPRSLAQEIQVNLRDPQTSELLIGDRQPITAQAAHEFPYAFHFAFDLPAKLTTRLVLGEVTLYGTVVGESVAVPLKSQSFTVTVDPESLLKEFERVNAVFASHADSDDLTELADQFCIAMLRESKRASLDLSFLNLSAAEPDYVSPAASVTMPLVMATTDQSNPIATQPVRTRSQRILPPQLHQPSPPSASDPSEKKRLDLPSFSTPNPSFSTLALQESAPDATETPETAAAGDWSDLNSLVAAMPLSLESPQSVAAVEETLGDETPAKESPGNETLGDETPEDPAPAAKKTGDTTASPADPAIASASLLPSPEQIEFQWLNLESRFLNRLNALATDTELLNLLRSQMPDQASSNDSSPVDAQTVQQSVPLASMPDTDEVVVDDDPAWQDWIRRPHTVKSQRVAADSDRENPLRLPSDQPVPTPVVEVLTPEIVAGQPMIIRVKLPNLTPKIYVKLWINDRQTRSLLDGPRWLVEFFPNGFGELEVVTQMTAPFGSLDIRLEAIAVEIQTQRESPKISLEHSVLPSELLEESLFAEVDF